MTKKMTELIIRFDPETVPSFIAEEILKGNAQLVRCKNCIYWWKENELCMHPEHCGGDGMVSLCYMTCRADDYCSKGENK